MSRQEDFDTQSDKYVEMRKSFGVNDPYALKEIGEAHYQGSEHGYYYWKVIEWRQYPSDEKYDDARAINQLLFKIYHLEEFAYRVEPESLYAFEAVVAFSRNTGERIDLILSHPKRSIDELEEIAIKFGKWADENIKEIKE